jgi:transcriptional regulator with XRE-family HTH domain
MMQGSLAERLRVLRAQRGLSLTEASEKIGVNRHTLRDLERGKREPYGPTLRKIAEGYNVPVARLLEEPVLAGKGEAPQGTGRAEWDVAVRRARRLRMRGRIDMENALASWRESKERGESPDARRDYLDEMGELLQRAYDAVMALWSALRTNRLDLVDQDEFAEVQEADRFYVDLWQLVRNAGLSIRTGSAQQGEAAHAGQPEVEAHTVGEPEAA